MKKILIVLVIVLVLVQMGQSQEIKPGWYGIIGISESMHSFHNYAQTFRTDEGLLTNDYPSARFALMGHIGGWKQIYNSWGVQACTGFSFLYGDDIRKTLTSQLGISYDLTNLTERQSPTRFMLVGGLAYAHIFKSTESTRGNAIGPYAGVNLIYKKLGLFAEYAPMLNKHSDKLTAYTLGFSYYIGVPTKGNKSVF